VHSDILLHCQINEIQISLVILNHRHCHNTHLQGRENVVHVIESQLHASWSGVSQLCCIINGTYSIHCGTVSQNCLPTPSPHKQALVLVLNMESQTGQITLCGTFVVGSRTKKKTWTFSPFLFLLLGEDGTRWLKGWRSLLIFESSPIQTSAGTTTILIGIFFDFITPLRCMMREKTTTTSFTASSINHSFYNSTFYDVSEKSRNPYLNIYWRL
jgi:hypothetical protein